MADHKFLITEKNGNILKVTINRPDALNALNSEVIRELQKVFDENKEDDCIRCVLLTGAGAKAFVAGADISELAGLDQREGADLSARSLSLMQSIQDFPTPVIAVINGFALGGGCELAMACDIRLASATARLGQPEVNLGLLPCFGGTQRLPRIVGRGKAMQLIFTGALISADEAYRIGLVDEVYPPETLMENALIMAKTIAAKAPLAIRLAKEAIRRGLDVTLSEGCDMENRNFGLACATADKNEGTAAFLEKRKPNFQGK